MMRAPQGWLLALAAAAVAGCGGGWDHRLYLTINGDEQHLKLVQEQPGFY